MSFLSFYFDRASLCIMHSLIGAASKLSKGRLASLALQYYEDIQLHCISVYIIQ